MTLCLRGLGVVCTFSFLMEIAGQKGFVMENARKVDLSGLTVDVKEGEPITRRNVQ
ncbi:MAG: hypothetical protein NTW28_34665 [Candidatus Solibacter sp.]|nr:hypothetical protein [Candidatus Solibacter sp.]